MNSEWVKPFYKRQFEMFNDYNEYSQYYEIVAKEIFNQISKPFETVLEIGAGNGNLARAISSFGKEVTTVELVPEMVEFAKQYNHEKLTSLCGSFYEIELPYSYDVLLYIDGFGVGTDEEQLFLLNRIHGWLNENGVGLIDIYNPTYWKKADGLEMYIEPNVNVLRRYGFDYKNQRMTDTWWEAEKPQETFTQSLACYSPDEIHKLCEQANLKIVDVYPGGAMDWEEWKFHEKVSLEECLSYRIKVIKA